MSSISEFQAKLRWPIAALFIAFGVGQINHYKQSDYYQSQINDWAKEQVDFSKMIGHESPKDGVLLIFGEDWNPTIPYYSERYANMIRWTGFWKSSIFAESIRITEEQGRFICGIVTVNAEPFLSELHGLSEKWGYILEEPIYSSNKRWAYYPIKPASNVENRP